MTFTGIYGQPFYDAANDLVLVNEIESIDQDITLQPTASRPSIIVTLVKWVGDYALVMDGFNDYFVHRNDIL